jgi:photosystem II stability/assembly factor-like uncharacterized protein
VAGDGGLLLTTEDGGGTWRTVDAHVTADLRAVALVDEARVLVAGDGVLLGSDDAGVTWRAVPAPAVSWTALAAVRPSGVALLTTAEGDLYRLDGSLVRVAEQPAGPLRAVAVSPSGDVAMAVGEAGAMLLSTDGGRTWRDRPSGTTRALHGVWLVGEDRVLAVGEGGVLVDGAATSMTGTSPAVLGPGATLRAVHLSAAGGGAIVGDGGTVFVTDDAGAHWSPVAIGDQRNVLAADTLGDD